MSRTSPPNFRKWLPDTRLSESANVREYGSYGALTPLPALLTRTSWPGDASPVLPDCPAMPLLATVPPRLTRMPPTPAGATPP